MKVERPCCEKTYASLAKSLLNDIVTATDPSSELAVDILDALRTEANNRHPRHPMIISMLERTDLTKVLTKTVQVCKRQMRRTRDNGRNNSKSFDEFGEWDKAMQSAEILLSFFEEAADNQDRGEIDKYDTNAASEVLHSEIKPRQTVCTEVELATEQLQGVYTSIKYGGNRGNDRHFVSPTPTTRSILLGDDGKCSDSSPPEDTSSDIMDSAKYSPKDDNESVACDSEDDCAEESNYQCSIIDDDQILNTTIKATIYNEDTLPESRYKVTQRVYAKDDSTGLLYPAFVRKVMWGPKVDNTKLIVKDQSVVENDDEDDEDEDVRRWSPKHNTFHYYVHFYGWAVTWDRWVHQEYLYEDSKFTISLSKLLTSEYKKVQPKKGQRMSLIQMATWMKRIVELEAELNTTENEVSTGENDEGKCNITTDNMESKAEVDCANGKSVHDDKRMDYTSATVKKVTEDDKCCIRVRVKVDTSEPFDNLASDMDSVMEVMEVMVDEPTLPITTAMLQKQAKLHESGLKLKHKKLLSDQLTLPFNLKKILVEEWEVITQCNMLHNLPCNTSVRKALNVYLESKLEPLRKVRANESDDGEIDTCGASTGDKGGCTGTKMTEDNVGKEWIDMVEGIALFFDQALPAHLLFTEERGQYDSLIRQIRTQRRNFSMAARAASITLEGDGLSSAPSGSSTVMAIPSDGDGDGKSPSNNNILPERMSDIYGCEHLTRLFLRLPGVIAESPTMTGMDARRIFAKVGDLVRFLQKNQSLFESSFRKPLAGEMRRGGSTTGVGGKRNSRRTK